MRTTEVSKVLTDRNLGAQPAMFVGSKKIFTPARLEINQLS